MKPLGIRIIMLLVLNHFAFAQDLQVGGPCADCEALLDYRLLSVEPKACDTLPGFMEYAPKIKITGTVFKKDGKTPAANVILYVYHVGPKGYYLPGDNPIGWEKRHGQYRGWLKTDTHGRYTFFTFRPAHYPGRAEPEHIHIYVKEEDTMPYYIDSLHFESDPLLTAEKKEAERQRGGSGIVRLERKNGIWTANRDIRLGLNIPDYK